MVHAESGADESKKQEACTILLFASTAASVIEDACSFRDGVVGKYRTFFRDIGCQMPEGGMGLIEKVRSELNTGIQETFKAKGRQATCKSARKNYDDLNNQLKYWQSALPKTATKPDTDAEYYPIFLDDLKIDAEFLSGRKVRVNGFGYYVMNSFMLKKSATDMSPMLIDIANLQRNQKQQILNQCGDIMTGCRVRIYGTVGKVSYQIGIIAENIKW